MDLSGLLLSQNLSFPSQQQDVLGGDQGLDSGENEFGDLLGLVDSLEVAESGEGTESSELVSKMLEGVADGEADLVLDQKAISLARLDETNSSQLTPVSGVEDALAEEIQQNALLPMNQETAVNASQLNAGKIVGHHSGDEMTFQTNAGKPEFATELFSRSAQGNLAMNVARNQSAEKLGVEQVAAWSQGLSSGEITSVDLTKAADPFLAQKQQAVAENKTQATSNVSRPESLEAEVPVQPKLQPGVDLSAKRSAAIDGGFKLETPERVTADVSNGVPAATSLRADSRSSDSSESRTIKDFGLASVGTSHSSESAASEGRADSGSKDSQSGESQFARDFLLGRSISNEGAKVDTSSALKTPEISSEVVDFVADRVNQLQKVGGDTLRVKMDSAGLGELEIKVSVRKGVVDVSIRADAEGATSALKTSGAELKAKLEQVVELGDLDIATGIAEKQAQRLGAQASKAQLGVDFASMGAEGLDGSEAGFKDASRSNDAGSFDRRDGEGSAFEQREQSLAQGGQREEKRDEAMDQWRNVFESRKTA